jgi:uncharacterized membrane protein
MKTDNVILMQKAREALGGRWGIAIITCLIYNLILSVQFTYRLTAAPNFGLGIGIIGLLIAGPLTLGLITFSLAIARNQDADIGQLFLGFRRMEVAILAYILVAIYTILWLLLLIVPGIVAAISYSQTFYIIAEDPDIRPSEAIDKSKKMMDGYKLKYFYLCLRFILLALLCILTLGIGFLWLMPYIQVTNAKFYDDVKSQVV